MKVQLAIFKEKHGKRYFAYKTYAQLYKICLKILKERFDECWYTPGNTSWDIPKILSSKNGKLARDFLITRSNFEYEGFVEDVTEDY